MTAARGLYFALSDRLSVYCEYWTTKHDALYTVTVVRDCVQRETDQARSRATFMVVRESCV